MNRINVLNIITIIHDGGLERHVYYIINKKQNESINHSVVILTKQDNNQLFEKYRDLKINIGLFNFDNKLFGIRAFFNNLQQLFMLAWFIKKNKIDVVHTHDFFPALMSRLSVIIAAMFFFHRVKKVYVTLHIVFTWLKTYHHLINKALSYFTTKIVCLSYAILNYSLQSDRIKRNKYCIIYTGVDTSKFIRMDSFRIDYLKEFGFKEENFVIGNIGVLSIRKGQIYLVKAFNNLIKRYPFLRLIIVGGERPHELDIKSELYDYIRSNELEEFIRILDPRDDIYKLYNVFDVFCMPSVTEGLSACSIEAMLMERVCLFSDIEPFKELVTDKENGYLFINKDAEDLEEKLNFILTNYKSLDYIKKNARKSVLEKFDVKDMVAKYEKLYLA